MAYDHFHRGNQDHLILQLRSCWSLYPLVISQAFEATCFSRYSAAISVLRTAIIVGEEEYWNIICCEKLCACTKEDTPNIKRLKKQSHSASPISYLQCSDAYTSTTASKQANKQTYAQKIPECIYCVALSERTADGASVRKQRCGGKICAVHSLPFYRTKRSPKGISCALHSAIKHSILNNLQLTKESRVSRSITFNSNR